MSFNRLNEFYFHGWQLLKGFCRGIFHIFACVCVEILHIKTLCHDAVVVYLLFVYYVFFYSSLKEVEPCDTQCIATYDWQLYIFNIKAIDRVNSWNIVNGIILV